MEDPAPSVEDPSQRFFDYFDELARTACVQCAPSGLTRDIGTVLGETKFAQRRSECFPDKMGNPPDRPLSPSEFQNIIDGLRELTIDPTRRSLTSGRKVFTEEQLAELESRYQAYAEWTPRGAPNPSKAVQKLEVELQLLKRSGHRFKFATVGEITDGRQLGALLHAAIHWHRSEGKPLKGERVARAGLSVIETRENPFRLSRDDVFQLIPLVLHDGQFCAHQGALLAERRDYTKRFAARRNVDPVYHVGEQMGLGYETWKSDAPFARLRESSALTTAIHSYPELINPQFANFDATRAARHRGIGFHETGRGELVGRTPKSLLLEALAVSKSQKRNEDMVAIHQEMARWLTAQGAFDDAWDHLVEADKVLLRYPNALAYRRALLLISKSIFYRHRWHALKEVFDLDALRGYEKDASLALRNLGLFEQAERLESRLT